MIKILAATALSVVMAVTSVIPAGATSIFVGGHPVPIEKAQYRDSCRDGRYVDRPGYYHGHRGYRGYRPGYRRHNDGFWYPRAVFGLGAAIMGGMATQRPPRPQMGMALPAQHVRWCQSRYRSYDGYSNTFQPNRGPRQSCVSPYYR